MLKTNDKFVAGNKAAVDSMLTIINASLNSAERLAALNLNTALALMSDNAATVSALLAVLKEIIESQSVEMKKNFSAVVEQSLKNAPAGSETIVAAMKSSFAAADSAYENMTKAAKQATATIEATVVSAKEAAGKFVAKAA